MKIKACLHFNNSLRLLLALVFLASGAHAAKGNTQHSGRNFTFHDSILVKVSFTSIYGKIKLYSNLSSKSLFFTALGDERKMYQLFLFDMGGKLVSQKRIRNSETALLPGMDKGNYTFEVFNNDDRIEYGSLVVK